MNPCTSNCRMHIPCYKKPCDWYHICHPVIGPSTLVKKVFLEGLGMSVKELARATCIPECEWDKILLECEPLREDYIDILVRTFNIPSSIWKQLLYNKFRFERFNSCECWSTQIEY